MKAKPVRLTTHVKSPFLRNSCLRNISKPSCFSFESTTVFGKFIDVFVVKEVKFPTHTLCMNGRVIKTKRIIKDRLACEVSYLPRSCESQANLGDRRP